MSHSRDKVLVVCSEGYRQPEKTRAEAERWIERHEQRLRNFPEKNFCTGTHTIEERKPDA